jgi:hypothetical protein
LKEWWYNSCFYHIENQHPDRQEPDHTTRRDGFMSHLLKALSGNPDRREALRDWLGMYVLTLLVTSVLILLAR